MKIYSSYKIFLAFVVLILSLFPAVLRASEEYMVIKGDTLWDISSEKLKDPFLWKKLWKANPQIKNPDLIFPGQKLNMPEGLAEQKEGEGKEEAEDIKETGRVIPHEKIISKTVPVLKRAYLVSRELLLSSGYVSEDMPGVGKISGSPQRKTIFGRGDFVYIDTDKPAAINTRFYITSKPEKIVHPITDDLVGYLIRIKGVAETVGEDNSNVKALIRESYTEITKEDLLSFYYPVEPPLEPIVQRAPHINGVIIKLLGGVNVTATHNVVYLDKGGADGVNIGDTYNIRTKEKPHISIGTLQVISVKDKTSAALVKKAVSEIKAGDSFGK